MNVSFIHGGTPNMASYRYRCAAPAAQVSATINGNAPVLVFCKPQPAEVEYIKGFVPYWRRIVVDFCDDHFNEPHYQDFASCAHAITCPTKKMQSIILEKFNKLATVIPDAYEFDELPPHCNGKNLLWFGHAVNGKSLMRIIADIPTDFHLDVLSNLHGYPQWSLEAMPQAFAKADIVIIPATAAYKSPNRAVEAIRQGCFVVAEPHPSLNDIPGIWIGDIKEGIIWASQNLQEANHRTKLAQTMVRTAFSPERMGSAWKTLLTALTSTSATVGKGGLVLST